MRVCVSVRALGIQLPTTSKTFFFFARFRGHEAASAIRCTKEGLDGLHVEPAFALKLDSKANYSTLSMISQGLSWPATNQTFDIELWLY